MLNDQVNFQFLQKIRSDGHQRAVCTYTQNKGKKKFVRRKIKVEIFHRILYQRLQYYHFAMPIMAKTSKVMA